MSAIVTNRCFLTLPEVALMLRVSPRTVRRMIDRDGLPAFRVGGSVRIASDELEAWLDAEPIEDSALLPAETAPAERRPAVPVSAEAPALAGHKGRS